MPLLRVVFTPVDTSFLSHKLKKLGVAGIKLEFIIDIHPFHFLGIIASFQGQRSMTSPVSS